MVKIFLTGASGFIGSVICELAVKAGHSVRGLVRSDAGAEKVKALGVEPVRGDLYTLDVLAEEAKKADAVLHLAFIHDFTKYQAAILQDRVVVETFIEALAGSNKTLVITSGTAAFWDTGDSFADEKTPIKPSAMLTTSRADTDVICVQAASRGIRTAAMRLSIYVYGRDSPTSFIPRQIAKAEETGVARYIGEGANLVTVVHVDDVAAAYVLAAEKPFTPGTIFNLGDKYDTGVSQKKIAEAIAERLSLPPAVSMSQEEAAQVWGPLLASLFVINNQYTSAVAEKELGWKVAEGRSVLKYIAEGGRGKA